jgi:hypothetical protein
MILVMYRIRSEQGAVVVVDDAGSTRHTALVSLIDEDDRRR